MMTFKLHPEFLTKDGKPEFAVLPYDEFVALREWLDDMEDLRDLEEARMLESGIPGIPIEDVERELGLR